MSAEYIAAIIGAVGTVAAAFVGVLTWYLTSRADRRQELAMRARPHGATSSICATSACSISSSRLHAEILAGVPRQPPSADARRSRICACARPSPSRHADKTDFVFESLKGDISILPAEVIHAVVQYYRVADAVEPRDRGSARSRIS